jgi:hypothetical protein
MAERPLMPNRLNSIIAQREREGGARGGATTTRRRMRVRKGGCVLCIRVPQAGGRAPFPPP